MGLFERIKTRLVRTRSALSDGITGLFRGGRAMDDALLSELEALLYSADLGSLALELIEDLKRRHKRGEVRGEDDVRESLKSSLLERLHAPVGEYTPTTKPAVILVVGVNGSGKTTTIAKLAHRFATRGQTVLVGRATRIARPPPTSWRSGPSAARCSSCARRRAPIRPRWPSRRSRPRRCSTTSW